MAPIVRRPTLLMGKHVRESVFVDQVGAGHRHRRGRRRMTQETRRRSRPGNDRVSTLRIPRLLGHEIIVHSAFRRLGVETAEEESLATLELAEMYRARRAEALERVVSGEDAWEVLATMRGEAYRGQAEFEHWRFYLFHWPYGA